MKKMNLISIPSLVLWFALWYSPVGVQAQTITQEQFESWRTPRVQFFYDNIGRHIGQDGILEQLPSYLQFYAVQFDSTKSEFSLEGRAYRFAKPEKNDTIGADVTIFLAERGGTKFGDDTLVRIRKIYESNGGSLSGGGIFPDRLGDFRVRFRATPDQKLYFKTSMSGLVEFNIDRLRANLAVDTRAISQFWGVVELLKKGSFTFDLSSWKYYYGMPGNWDYMEKNRSLEQAEEHRRFLELVFRPSMADSLKALLASGAAPADDMLDNLLYIKKHEAELKEYCKVARSGSYLLDCIKTARTFLPPGKIKPIPSNLTIYFMAMAFDAAVQDSSMYFGIARLYEYDRFVKGALAAHELHHQMRVDMPIRNPLSSADSACFETVDDINNEGSEDLIDKMLLIDHPGEVFRSASLVHRLMDMAPEAIARLDSCFIVNAMKGQDNYVRRSQFYRVTNYSSGHLPGMYMANVIRRNGLQQRLIEHCDNPFQFFYLYNEAARKDAARPPRFSDAAIAYLHTLEQRSFGL